MSSKQNIKKISEWQEANTDLLRIRARKEANIPERIQALVEKGKAKSRQAYIVDAILAALKHEEMLLDTNKGAPGD